MFWGHVSQYAEVWRMQPGESFVDVSEWKILLLIDKQICYCFQKFDVERRIFKQSMTCELLRLYYTEI